MRIRIFFLVSVFLLLPFSEANAEELFGRVVSVSDGDTIGVLTANREQVRIRISGIDAPEKSQPFGQVSKQRTSDLCFGADVKVTWHKKDRYGRTIGKVEVRGSDIGLTLVRDGLAWHYKQYESEQTPIDRIAYSTAERQARSSARGLWRDAAPIPPWEFRKEKRSGRKTAPSQ